MSDLTVISFDPDTAPLEPWDPIPADSILNGNPNQSGVTFFTADGASVTAGIWQCTAFDEIPAPYSVDEFIVILEGSLNLVDCDGATQTFKAGDGFVIPRGAEVQWKQPSVLRKFWFIYDNPKAAGSAKQGLKPLLADPNAALPAVPDQDASLYESRVPEMGWLTLYQDPENKFKAGVWDCSPMKRKATTIERSELMHILEGSGSITNADGVVFNFSAGDTFLVPVGMGYQWQNDEYVKKIFCSFTP